ncbi:PglL family O-oligosaccharyltransferase [Ramlibacter sp. Leaf400]|uniref:PglL family O-oligosaccharyltransferase n=1 Tax=Ramlibacter sp. Leaf400 TaxID=1736365 RepID=UPI0009EC3F39|nr:O-antigen ligase family protein [Ramlibacter sp. Leaf400]
MLLAWAWLSQKHPQPDVLYLAGGLVLIALAAAAAQDIELRPALATGVLFAATISAVLGLLQYLGLADKLYPWVNAAHAGEAYANLRQPNQFATLCSMGVAMVVWGFPRIPRGASLALLALFTIASAASVSRTGAVQGFLLLALAVVWKGEGRRDRVLLCLGGGIVYLAAAWALPHLLEVIGEVPTRTLWGRISGGESCSSRTILWSNVLTLIAARPLLGWGWGELDFAHFMNLYSGARFCEILDNAHNLPLHLAVELGLPAAIAVCAAALAWAWRLRPLREHDPIRQLAWALLGLLLLHSLLEYPLWYGPFQIALGTCIGWLLTTPEGTGDRSARRAGRFAAAVLFLGVAVVAWDYWRVSQVYLPAEERRPAWAHAPMDEARHSWLFANQARFAELTLATISRDNANWMYGLSKEMLHHSPEPRVIERLIESATMTGRTEEAVLLLARYRAAFPSEYLTWRESQRRASSPVPGKVQD